VDVVKHAEGALRPGGILLAYLPTINQTQLLRETLRHHSFGLEETVEILRRTWHIDGAQCDRITGWSPTRIHYERAPFGEARRGYLVVSMKMHSPGHSSEASVTASSIPAGTTAMPSAPRARSSRPRLFHVGQAVVEQGEHVGADLFAETVSGAQVLVNPNFI